MRLRCIFLTLLFVWSLLSIVDAEEPVLLEHGGGVRTVEFSPVDAARVATAGESGLIKLWNLQNDTVETLRGHTGIVNAVAFSPDGALLASGGEDRTVKVWNVHSQHSIATLRHSTARIKSLAFSPDGQMLATGGDQHVKLWRVPGWTQIATLRHEAWARTLAFSPDGQFLAAGQGHEGPGLVTVWNVQTRQGVATLAGDSNRVWTLAFSPDNRRLVGSGRDKHLKVWDVSNWELLSTRPQAGGYDIAFSPDGKMLASTNNRSVNLWWFEDGTGVARMPGDNGMHFVDFSHDGASLAAAGEDGSIRIWRVNTALEGNTGGGIRILPVDTYLQQLPKANAGTGDNIPEPVPPPVVVRDFFGLDPFYEQWIDVGGFPVIASAQVNPYAVKEAAWLIEKMIGHRRDVLRAMVDNKTRFAVIAHTEIITEIPEYRKDAPPDFVIYRERGWGGSKAATVSSSEENLLRYPGPHSRSYNVMIHEFAHAIHRLGLNSLDPMFDQRLQEIYKRAMQKGLWQGTYASSDRKEYWAEGTLAWFHYEGAGSFHRFGNTRQALKAYDPALATLLAGIYGDRGWRYTPVETRTHQSHLRGFNPQDSPTFEGWPELEALYKELSNPNSTGGGKWVNLKSYAPNQLSRLKGSNVHQDRTTMIFVNATDADVLIYGVSSNATGSFWTRIYPGRVRWTGSGVDKIWLVKKANGRNMAVFQAEAQTGRALIGASANKTRHATQGDVSRNDSQPQVLIAQSQRPPLYWIAAGTLHRLVGPHVQPLVPSVQNATSLAVDMTAGKLYWTEKTGNTTGSIQRANLDGTHRHLVKSLTSVPLDIALDTAGRKLYVSNAWGKVQRLNLDGSHFQPNLITGLQSPHHLALDVAQGKVYWTEQTGERRGKIRRANLDGTHRHLVKTLTSVPRGIAIDTVHAKLYVSNAWGKVQRLNLDGSHFQPNLITGLKVPRDVVVDVAAGKLYWAESGAGRIRRASLTGGNIQTVVTGLDAPARLACGIAPVTPAIAAAPAVQTVFPEMTDLLANYPNPFNPETWIPYQLVRAADVRIAIYAVDGTLVRRLALGHRPAGIYQRKSRAAYWDGRNAQGEPVASGVYFYTLTTGDFTATRKMLIWE